MKTSDPGNFSQKLSEKFWSLLQTDPPIPRSNERIVAMVRNAQLLRKFHREILMKSFPEGDLDTSAELVAGVMLNDYAVILVQEGREILGGIVIEHSWSTEKSVMLIAWLAVNESHRNKNIGTILVEEALLYAKANGARILLGEVEDPKVFVEESSGRGNPAKRVKFYSRFDCQRLEVPYVIPARYDEDEPVFGVMLTLFPLSEEQKTAAEISSPDLAIFAEEFMGTDTEEGINLLEACEGVVALTPYKKLF
jgi:GNAT superfamily N-acetyltransferase